MKLHQVILRAVAEVAPTLPGMGVMVGDRLHMVCQPEDHVAETVRQLSRSKLGTELLSRICAAPRSAGYHRVGLPFGIDCRQFPLDAVVNAHAAILIVESVDPEAASKTDRAQLGSLPRKHKKLVQCILSNAQRWRNPYASSIEGVFNEIAVSVRKAVEEYYEEAFTKSLSSYKDFVSSFSHEALGPIQELRTTLELTVSQSDLTESTASRLKSSLQALDGLRVSLEGMRLLFRDGQRKPLSNQFRECDVGAIVRRWLVFYKSQFQAKNIETILEPPLQQWKLRCVPEYIEVMVRNLVSNGVKYSFDASGYTTGKFLVRFDSSNRRLSFVNFGVPISPDDIESEALFTRGHRGGTADDRGRVGKGVGLYLVRLITDLHKAKCVVRSEIQNRGGNEEFARTEFAIEFSGPRGGL